MPGYLAVEEYEGVQIVDGSEQPQREGYSAVASQKHCALHSMRAWMRSGVVCMRGRLRPRRPLAAGWERQAASVRHACRSSACAPPGFERPTSARAPHGGSQDWWRHVASWMLPRGPLEPNSEQTQASHAPPRCQFNRSRASPVGRASAPHTRQAPWAHRSLPQSTSLSNHSHAHQSAAEPLHALQRSASLRAAVQLSQRAARPTPHPTALKSTFSTTPPPLHDLPHASLGLRGASLDSPAAAAAMATEQNLQSERRASPDPSMPRSCRGRRPAGRAKGLDEAAGASLNPAPSTPCSPLCSHG